MSVYIVAQIDIHDRAEYEKYQAGFMEVFERYAGELLSVSEDPIVAEGEWPWTRTVLIHFPSAEEARAWYGSAEYQELVQHRHRASKANIVLVEGLDPS